MLLLSILLFSAVVPLTSVHMSSHVFNRLAILVLLYSSVLAWNMLYLEPIGVGLGIYGGLSHVTLLSQAFDTFILACASIVVTAVYILRAMGKVIMGPLYRAEGVENTSLPQSVSLADAGWNEKVAATILIIGILAIGIAPFWLTELIK
jgi:hypothetical protein